MNSLTTACDKDIIIISSLPESAGTLVDLSSESDADGVDINLVLDDGAFGATIHTTTMQTNSWQSPPIPNYTMSSTSYMPAAQWGQLHPTALQMSDIGLKIGEDFSITVPEGGTPEMVYKDQVLKIEELIGMVNSFKILLKAVASDEDFCKKYPEIKDLAYGYLLEEFKR